jgi:hypothetical protein
MKQSACILFRGHCMPPYGEKNKTRWVQQVSASVDKIMEYDRESRRKYTGIYNKVPNCVSHSGEGQGLEQMS